MSFKKIIKTPEFLSWFFSIFLAIISFIIFISFVEVGNTRSNPTLNNNPQIGDHPVVEEIANKSPEKETEKIITNKVKKPENEDVGDITDEDLEKSNLDTQKSDNDIEENNDLITENYYLVTRVVDGDTVDVVINGNVERLRLIGIDTPETAESRKPMECFGVEASNKAKELLTGKKVKLVSDNTQDDRDIYGRLLRYLYLEDGTFFNEWMIENGYAHEYTYIVPYIYQIEFQQAENYAKTNELGLWNSEVCNQFNEGNIIIGGKFYTSSYYNSKFYYCDTDSAWDGLSKKYLESYGSETELLEKYPSKTLHEPCK